MGKKRSKKKGAKPPDPRTLPFLQEMFPNIEKDIVEIVFEENEYDEEKTMQLLTEMSSDDSPKSFAEFVDDISNLDETVDNFGNIELDSERSKRSFSIYSTSTPSSSKNEPFISTIDTHSLSSSNSTTSNKRHSPQKSSASIPYTNTPLTTNRTTPSTKSTTPSFASPYKSPKMASSTTGESGQFLSSMFPELDPTMVSLLYEENGNDVGKTVESLLSIVFMNHTGSNDEEEDEARDEVENEALAEVADEAEAEEEEDENQYYESDEALEDEKEGDTEYFENGDVDIESDEADNEEIDADSIQSQFDADEFKFDVPQPIVKEEPSETVSAASQSEFIQNLKLLAELFPETPRTLLALELDEHDGNLQKTIESCCRADPEYLKKLSGEKASLLLPPKEEEKKYPTPVDKFLKPTWTRKGASKPEIKYVPFVPKTTTTTTTKSKSKAKGKGKATKSKEPATSSASKAMDLAAKLKLKQLREKFSFVDAEILEAVFMQSGHKVHATLVCLYDIYPHLRDASTSRGTTSSAPTEPGSPEEPLTRTKREKPSSSTKTTTTTTTTSTTTPEKPRKKRTKPTTEEDEDEGDFVTVSYRKKKTEASGTPFGKKVLDSEDIENTYQSYREKAVKAGEMRNLLFMQAAAAYQSGDGARAKALQQRARDYNEMMKEAHQQACYQIFNDCNARFDTLASVDLHGLHVAESLQVLSQLLDIHNQMGEDNNRKPKRLRVITGVGKHSLRGVAKIKPAVKNFLRSKGFKFQETEAGVITISLSR